MARKAFSTILLLIPILASLALLNTGSAFAVVNPYIAGANNASTAVPFVQIYGYNDFQGSTPASMTSDLLSIISTSGWNTAAHSGAGDATGTIYQGVVRLNKDDKVYADAQVWYQGSSTWNCFQSNTCTVLGTGSGMNYAYQTFYWNAARTQVTFYSEYHPITGSITYNYTTYSKKPSDTSNSFADGEIFKGSPYGDAYYKMLQFGVESDDSTSNWKTKQYGMTYYPLSGGTVSLGSLNVYDLTANGDYFTGSSITWTYDGSGNVVGWHVGTNPYTVKGDYHHINSSVPSGTITWWPGTPAITPGAQLWP